MPSVFDTISSWTRKTTSSFAQLCLAPVRRDAESMGPGLAYKLKHWPDLPHASKTAEIYRALSVMSHRPVNRHWLLISSGLRPAQIDQLLKRLVAQDAVEVTDTAKFLTPPASTD